MIFPGGKNLHGVYQRIINLIPPHRIYIETHLGSGAILRQKKRAEINIGLDIDPETISSFDANDDQLICCTDARQFLADYDFVGDEFIYSDPPYVKSTRRGGQLYKHEYSDRQHIELLTVLQRIPCNIMISGYWSELYAQQLTDWHCEAFESRDRSGRKVMEHLWMNYVAPPDELHDYRYLGDDFRDRQRIKRKQNRLKQKILGMPVRERNLLISELESLSAGLDG